MRRERDEKVAENALRLLQRTHCDCNRDRAEAGAENVMSLETAVENALPRQPESVGLLTSATDCGRRLPARNVLLAETTENVFNRQTTDWDGNRERVETAAENALRLRQRTR